VATIRVARGFLERRSNSDGVEAVLERSWLLSISESVSSSSLLLQFVQYRVKYPYNILVMNKYVVLLSAVVIAVTLHYGAAIKCYVCNSGADYQGDACNDPYKHQELIHDCDSLPDDVGRAHNNYTLCRKFLQDVEGDLRVVRSCATKGRVGRCIDRTGTAKIKLQYCECENTDPNTPCNDARPTVVVVGRTVVTLAAGVALLLSLRT